MDPKSDEKKRPAILSAVVQFSRRAGNADESGITEILDEYLHTTSILVTQWKGKMIGSFGDDVLAEFSSTTDAVQCAVEMEKFLRTKNEKFPKNRNMAVRIAINLKDEI